HAGREAHAAGAAHAAGEAGADAFARAREAALAAAAQLRERFYATPYRPTGASGRAAALAALVDDLDWLAQFAAHAPPPARADLRFPTETAELERAVAALLTAAADRLDGGSSQPDFARLAAARAALGAALLDAIENAPAGAGEVERALEQAFALRMLSYAAWHLAADALRARGEAVPEVDEAEAETSAAGGGMGVEVARDAVVASGRLAAAYASTRSVWFRNSVRGAVGLSLAVAIGQVAELQHAFWAVLAMVSTLRSRAVNTGFSLLQAVGGTFAGIVAGGLLVAVIDGDRTLLWCALPFALLLAAYAPRAISFVAGQAAFSLAVLVIFNLIRPVGWQVGLVRIEDIAIGGTISLAVGLLLWPRGAAAVLRDSLATAYASSAAVLDATVRKRLGDAAARTPGATPAPSPASAPPSAPPAVDGVAPAPSAPPAVDRDAALAHAIAASVADARRLDDALRQCLAEPGGTARERFGELTRLVAGSGRVRRTAHSLRSGRVLLPLTAADGTAAGAAQGRLALERELEQLSAWLRALGQAIEHRAAAPAPQPPAAPPH
ncbi:FUSC family protein, partial [Conexibacter sp. JD483]|uniref:FUSC family protein n=2 Tax=Conexibacter TaxID=191494 RepID=UPI002870557A